MCGKAPSITSRLGPNIVFGRMGQEVLNILSKGTKLREYTKGVENNVRQDELESIQVNDEYMRTLGILSKKLKFVEVDPMVKSSKALKDVQPELERLRQKAVAKVSE
ncbi:hypothetical protein QJS04_geneDACA003983 [Acorus gramineus]|uniref:Vps52 coiled-coil domain-containing protein n=1 Tax=Acorus gramineus TaxID=55184 RepID=A0AAV9BJP2_ACOGR|nr:hypothetical protein QJS04_geneDACA003983 [Acorus gramineus]